MGLSHPIYKVSSDDDGNPKIVLEQELRCRSKQCPNYDKVVDTIRNPINNVEAE